MAVINGVGWLEVFEKQLNVKPIAKSRPRFTRGRCYTPSKTKNAEQEIRLLVSKEFKLKPFEGPLRLDLILFFKKPKTSKNVFPVVKPDLDNVLKLVGDALNGVLWKDDSQIIEIVVSKYYASEASIYLKLYALSRA